RADEPGRIGTASRRIRPAKRDRARQPRRLTPQPLTRIHKEQEGQRTTIRVTPRSLFLRPLWEKVTIGGLRPRFVDKTLMLRIGYAKSVPDKGSLSANSIRDIRTRRQTP